MTFKFGEFSTNVHITKEVPSLKQIADDLKPEQTPQQAALIIADENTKSIAEKIAGGKVPLCILKSGEENKNWQSVEAILQTAFNSGLGRDGVFIAVGGGVICDLAGFAASVYMRGCNLVLVPTTLLAMADASVGGKTGFDMFAVKNIVGSFYPAKDVYMCLSCLSTLNQKELKSGFAEIIKTAVLDGDDFLDMLSEIPENWFSDASKIAENEILSKCIERAVQFKGAVVREDFRESGKRALLNLGHTFGHALEAACGLGNISHGEAVAWGIAQACSLGLSLGITPQKRAEKIKSLLVSFGYDCSQNNPLAATETFKNALNSDKKKKQGKLNFIVPDEKSACIVPVDNIERQLQNFSFCIC